MDNIQLMQLAVFGFCTGLGATFGAKLAKATLAQLKKRLEKVNERPKN